MTPSTAALTLTVAVAGNPNTGKSTLFNGLTGAAQQVGNYPGVTVQRKTGTCRFGEREATVVDLPGTYSLAAASPDEKVVLDALTGHIEGTPKPDAVICVVDASNLRRNLFLVTQIAEVGVPLVVALNMTDEAEAMGIRIDARKLSERLGIPCVATVAARSLGLDELRSAVAKALESPGRFTAVEWPEAVRSASRGLDGNGVSLRLLFDVDSPLVAARGLEAAQAKAHESLRAAGIDPISIEAVTRYAHIDRLIDGVATKADPAAARGFRADAILTHRVWGLVIFAVLMFVVFSSIYWIAKPVMDGINWAFDAFGGWVGAKLASKPMLESLVTKGIIKGVGGVLVFIPQILILFFFIAVLEDSGYMARAAFLMDKVFAWTGLNGKCFVPMLSSFACAVPSILATRTIDDPKARISTILVSPLMSCSARLPVYVLMIGAFVEPRYGAAWAGVALFAMHMLGLIVAIPAAFVINRFLLKSKPIPFLLEMPPYRRPRVKGVGLRMWRSGSEFVVRAGTVIFAFSIVIWALTYFPRPAELKERVTAECASRGVTEEKRVGREVESAYLEQSLLGRMGKGVQPVFAPCGFDWKITVAVLAAFPAREVLVSTLGIIYAAEEKDDEEEAKKALASKLERATWPDGRRVYTPAVATAIMIFFAFCLQCMSTITVIAKETGWKWAGFAFVYMTTLAWVGAVAAYQIGSRL